MDINIENYQGRSNQIGGPVLILKKTYFLKYNYYN